MWENDGTANRFHSPNQVQVEFLCDVADQSQSWVPNSVRLRATADANARSAARFINGPGYSCGAFVRGRTKPFKSELPRRQETATKKRSWCEQSSKS
jgi:hypothetical protein